MEGGGGGGGLKHNVTMTLWFSKIVWTSPLSLKRCSSILALYLCRYGLLVEIHSAHSVMYKYKYSKHVVVVLVESLLRFLIL